MKYQPSFLENTEAISEVVGEILLTAIAVIAFSVVAVSVFSYMDPQEQVHADIQGWVDVDSDTVYLRHAGGERVDIIKTRVLLDINGTRREVSSSELETIKGSDIWDLGETILINTSQLWSVDIGEDDNVALIMLTTNSNLVIKSGTLLGEDQGVGSYSGGSGNGTGPTAPILSGQNPLTPYGSTTSDVVTFSATSSQSSFNEFLLDGVHIAWSNGTSPSYTNTTPAAGTYTVTLLAKNTTDTSLTDSLIWTWTVTASTPTPSAPVLSGQNPSTPYGSTTSDAVTFSAVSSQSSYNEFLLNGVHLAWSNGTSPSYTNTTPAVGTYTLTLIASNTTNTSLTDSLTWTWTVTAPAPSISSGTNMLLEKIQKGGYIADGDYLKFITGGGGSSITIDGNNIDIENNNNVMLVMNGQQTSGEMDIGFSGGSRSITTYSFNVDLYLNGVLTDTGDITSIDISKADNIESTLSYYLPSYLSETYLSTDGDINIIIDRSPDNGSEIQFYNITPTSDSSLRMQFDPTYTYIGGFDANYTIG
ncbi:type IV pilin N-terminal domain-containing protein [Methanolobus sp. WCC4]|uniref:type IV pilin N-terminal domain-containing protein n=1 Tax=Methanolobus sp. WCC4 TaxID=3125784 RepID=UPI0030FB1397